MCVYVEGEQESSASDARSAARARVACSVYRAGAARVAQRYARGGRAIGRASARPSGAESKARVRPEPVRRTDIGLFDVPPPCLCTYTRRDRRVPYGVPVTIERQKPKRKRFFSLYF